MYHVVLLTRHAWINRYKRNGRDTQVGYHLTQVGYHLTQVTTEYSR
jgi:hypothetical protein